MNGYRFKTPAILAFPGAALVVALCLAAPAGAADTLLAARQAPTGSMVLDVPSNPDHAGASEVGVLSMDYDAAANGDGSSDVVGSLVLGESAAQLPVAGHCALGWFAVRERSGSGAVHRVVFHGVHVMKLARDGDNATRMQFVARSVTVR